MTNQDACHSINVQYQQQQQLVLLTNVEPLLRDSRPVHQAAGQQ